MPPLREQIREKLRKEIAALTKHKLAVATSVEYVNSSCGAALTRFAKQIVSQANGPDFVQQVESGELRFEPIAESFDDRKIVASQGRSLGDFFNKQLIGEREITGLDTSVPCLRIPLRSRLTPLAKNEARRRNIRIDRIKS